MTFHPRAFPSPPAGRCSIGYQCVLALRLTYVGELGWELYIPTPFALPVYDALIEAGKAHGLRHCGYHTLNSLRIEKAYRDWSHDMGPADTPLEAGLGFTCDWSKPGGFIGREALIGQRDAGLPRRRLVQFLLEDPQPLVYHNEPIYRDGERVGFVTSAMYGHTLGAAVALGYVAKPGRLQRSIRRRRPLSDRAWRSASERSCVARAALRSEESARPRLELREPTALRTEFDVVIAGGGVMGSACAYFLRTLPEFHGSILVVEPDPSYREAASTRSASSIRQQFSTPLNIALSSFGMQFLRDAPRRRAHSGLGQDLGLVESSYLFLATAHGRAALEKRVAIQQSASVAGDAS